MDATETNAAVLTLNRVRSIKPAASVVAAVEGNDGATLPAIVVQPFGKGRAASMLVGDFWRWHLKREGADVADASRFWRQVARWIVADVPRRVEVDVERRKLESHGEVRIRVKARNPAFQMLDNATVAITVTSPDNKELELSCQASGGESGVYDTVFMPTMPGGYRAEVVVTAEDGSEVGRTETGWISDPQTAEFRRLSPNRAWLEELAKETGGEVVEASALSEFVADLPNKKVPIVEPWSSPIWHKWTVLLVAVGLLVGEWGLRRWKGLP